MENLFIAATNLYGLRAIRVALQQKKLSDATILGCAMFGSIVYHLSETKHGMNSLILKDYVNITLNIDRLFAGIAAVTFLLKYKKKLNKKIISYGSVGLGMMMISECQHVISLSLPIEKQIYLLTHPIWHICAFHTAYLLLCKSHY